MAQLAMSLLLLTAFTAGLLKAHWSWLAQEVSHQGKGKVLARGVSSAAFASSWDPAF